MKIANVLIGLGAGVAAGLAVTYYRRSSENVFIQDNEADIERMKQSATDIKNYIAQIKNESTDFASSIAGDVKDIIGSFKSDIQPNIERLQGNIENIQNRVNEMAEGPKKD